jgi:predicted amidohydrolase
MTSKNKSLSVMSLQLKTEQSHKENLEKLLSIIKNTEAELIVAPELCLTDFDYENFESVAGFYETSLSQLLKAVSDKILVLTMTKKEGNNFVNQALVIHKHKVIHKQNKYRLFTLGDETKYFKAGVQEDIVKFTIDDVSYGLLICFELRFKELWKQLEGTDIVLIPARWGKPRKKHLEILSQALAIMNQTFVVVSNSADDDMASSSAIISPWGEIYMNDSLERLEQKLNFKEIKKSRRMINMN